MRYGGEPWESRGTGSCALFSTSTSSLLRVASCIASDSAAKSAWSSCPSVSSGPRASSAIELAVSEVSWTNASRSWSIAPSASGTTAAIRTAAVSSTSASAIRLVTAGSRLRAPGHRLPGRHDLAVRQPEAVAVDGLDQRRVAELAAQRRQVHVEHLGGPVPVLVPGPFDDLLPADQPAGVGDQALEDRELLRGQRNVGARYR